MQIKSSSNSLRDRAYQHIQQKILRGELSSGHVVSENTLAQEIGIRRTPVREGGNGRAHSRQQRGGSPAFDRAQSEHTPHDTPLILPDDVLEDLKRFESGN